MNTSETFLRAAALYLIEAETAIVPLPFLELPRQLELLGEHWVRKAEFHLTALHVETVVRRVQAQRGGSESQARADVHAALVPMTRTDEVSEVRLRQELRVVRARGERTIVVMADAPGVEHLHARLAAALGVELDPPPAHVTIYTGPDARGGIGLHTQLDLRELSEPLPPPDAAAGWQAVKEALGNGFDRSG